MTAVIHRNLKFSYPTAVSGKGPYIIDQNGKHYLDACSGAAVSCFGYNDPELSEVIYEQSQKMPFVHSSFFTTTILEETADLITKNAPTGLDYIYFVSGGSEAMETALKIARQYHVENGEPQRQHIIARKQSYHGNTLGALSIGGNVARREFFRPMLSENVSHVTPCFAYRYKHEGETDDVYVTRLAKELEAEILSVGEDRVMAFVAETVVGSTAGAVAPVDGYLKAIRAVCDKYGVLLILDEIMCGMGRTGYLYACEKDGVVPDLMTIAKGLGAGFQPVGAVLVSKEIEQLIASRSGSVMHGHTYICHASALACAKAVHERLIQPTLLQKIRHDGEQIVDLLKETLFPKPYFGELRGRGLFLAIEIVKNKETKEPFDTSYIKAHKVKEIGLEEGLMCYPSSGTIDGVEGDHILLAPPFIYETSQIEELSVKLERVLDRVWEGQAQ